MNSVNDPYGGLRIDKSGTNSRLIVRETGGLVFGTNDVEVARFDAAGKLGIGTTSPSEKLHVIGNIISSAKIEATTNIVAGGTIQSGAPAGYASKAMKWGEVLAVSNPSLNAIGISYQQAVQVDGVSYYVMLSDVLQ